MVSGPDELTADDFKLSWGRTTTLEALSSSSMAIDRVIGLQTGHV